MCRPGFNDWELLRIGVLGGLRKAYGSGFERYGHHW